MIILSVDWFHKRKYDWFHKGKYDWFFGRQDKCASQGLGHNFIKQMDTESNSPSSKRLKLQTMGGAAKVLFYILISYLVILSLVNVFEVFSKVRIYKVPGAIAALGGTVEDLVRLTKSAIYYHSGVAIRLLLGIGLMVFLFPLRGLSLIHGRAPNIFLPNTTSMAQACFFMALWGFLGALLSFMHIPVGFDAASSSLYLIPSLIWVILQGAITALIFCGLRRLGASPMIIILALVSFNMFSLATENIILSAAKLAFYSPLPRNPENAKFFELAAAEDFPEQRLFRQSGPPGYSDGLLTEIITFPTINGENENSIGYLASALGHRRMWSTHKHYAIRAMSLIVSPILATLLVLPSASILASFDIAPEAAIAALPVADLITGSVSVILSPLKLWFLRRETYGADAHAKSMGYGKQLATALAKDTDYNKAWTASWIYEKLFMSAPAALHRIEELTK